MRPIDADSMKAEVESLDAESNNRIYQCAMEDMLEFFIELIDKQPTIEPEVRHGRWIENRTDLICSACRWEYSDELRFMSHHGLDAVEEAFSYCPHCGAKMDGGADNGFD